MKSLGEKIKEERLAKGLSQSKLATLIFVSQKAIDFWEKGINEPKASYIRSIAKYFDVSTDYLLGLENEVGCKIPPTEQKTKDNYYPVPMVAHQPGAKDTRRMALLDEEQKAELLKAIAKNEELPF